MAQDQDVQELSTPVSARQPASDLLIRPVEPQDGPAIHALLTSALPDVLPHRERWLARWRWQHWDNPYRDERPAGYVLADETGIHGHLGAVYLPLRVGDAHTLAVVGTDYAVSPEAIAARGMFVALDLAQRLSTVCTQGFMMATTANEKTGAIFGRFGCRPIEWTREFWRASTGLGQQIRTCCGGSSRVLRRMMSGRFGPWLSKVLVTGCQRTGRLPRIPIRRGYSLDTTVPQLARDLGPLWERLWADTRPTRSPRATSDHDAGVAIHCSQAYLDWRYARHPERDRIRVLVLRDPGERAVGAAILFREERTDRNLVYVEEIICPSKDREALRTLLCAALRLAANSGADYLVTTPGRRSIRDLYWELGFESRARNGPAVVMACPQSEPSTAGTPREPAGSADTPHHPEDHLEFWHGMMF